MGKERREQGGLAKLFTMPHCATSEGAEKSAQAVGIDASKKHGGSRIDRERNGSRDS